MTLFLKISTEKGAVFRLLYFFKESEAKNMQLKHCQYICNIVRQHITKQYNITSDIQAINVNSNSLGYYQDSKIYINALAVNDINNIVRKIFHESTHLLQHQQQRIAIRHHQKVLAIFCDYHTDPFHYLGYLLDPVEVEARVAEEKLIIQVSRHLLTQVDKYLAAIYQFGPKKAVLYQYRSYGGQVYFPHKLAQRVRELGFEKLVSRIY